MKYQIRIFIKRSGTESLQKKLSALGFAIYKENRWTKTLEPVDGSTAEIIDFRSKTTIIQEIENDELTPDEFCDCFHNTNDDDLVKEIDRIINENINLVYGYSKKFAISELWRV